MQATYFLEETKNRISFENRSLKSVNVYCTRQGVIRVHDLLRTPLTNIEDWIVPEMISTVGRYSNKLFFRAYLTTQKKIIKILLDK